MLSHQVRLHFGNGGGLQNTCAVATGAHRQRLGDRHTFALGIVLPVHGDQGRYPKAPLVLFPHFGAGALGAHHDHRQVLADLHPFLNQIEAMGIIQAGALFHEGHDRGDHRGVLLVGGQVHDHISPGN